MTISGAIRPEIGEKRKPEPAGEPVPAEPAAPVAPVEEAGQPE